MQQLETNPPLAVVAVGSADLWCGHVNHGDRASDEAADFIRRVSRCAESPQQPNVRAGLLSSGKAGSVRIHMPVAHTTADEAPDMQNWRLISKSVAHTTQGEAPDEQIWRITPPRLLLAWCQ